MDNLLQAFPGMTQAEAEALATRVYEHFGRATVEVAFGDRLLKPSTFSDHIVLRNEHYLRDVLAAGKGAIFVSAHLGPWEMFGMLARHWGIPLTSVYRPVKNPYIDRFMRRYRVEHGQTFIPKYGAVLALLRLLRRGGYIALLADQHAKDEGLWVPFFGPAGLDDAGAGVPGVQDRRADRHRLRAPAAGAVSLRSLLRRADVRPADGRPPGRHTERHDRDQPPARELRPAGPGSVALDASPLAHAAGGGLGERESGCRITWFGWLRRPGIRACSSSAT